MKRIDWCLPEYRGLGGLVQKVKRWRSTDG